MSEKISGVGSYVLHRFHYSFLEITYTNGMTHLLTYEKITTLWDACTNLRLWPTGCSNNIWNIFCPRFRILGVWKQWVSRQAQIEFTARCHQDNNRYGCDSVFYCVYFFLCVLFWLIDQLLIDQLFFCALSVSIFHDF